MFYIVKLPFPEAARKLPRHTYILLYVSSRLPLPAANVLSQLINPLSIGISSRHREYLAMFSSDGAGHGIQRPGFH